MDSVHNFLVTFVFVSRYIGTMQICVARMLKESGIFFAVRQTNCYFLKSRLMKNHSCYLS